MNTRKRLLIATVLLGFLLVHFFSIFISCIPVKIKNEKLIFLSQQYIYPFFQQNWSLFVPTPTSRKMICVRYKVEKGWSDWEDVLRKEVIKHQQNRILGREIIVLLLSNSVRYISINQDSINTKIEYEILKHSINQYLKLYYKLEKGNEYELLLIDVVGKKHTPYYQKKLIIL